MAQSTNAAGLAIIKEHEKCRLAAYLDCSSPPVPTIGWGSTKDVHMGLVITQEEADARLVSDVSEAESQVSRVVKVPLTPNQFSALVSFTFNLGVGELMLSELLAVLNQHNYASAAHNFMRFIWAGGEPRDDLYFRRKAERALFLTR